MTFQPKPKQALVLWRLIVTGEVPAQSNITPGLTAQERQQLVSAGLIELVDREDLEKLIAEGSIDTRLIDAKKAKKYVVLTDKAWDWANDNYAVELSIKNSPVPAKVLQALLARIDSFLGSTEFALVDLVRPQSKPEVGLEQRIREAYTHVSGNRYNTRVRLAQLRQFLTDFSRKQIDETLGKMEIAGELVLMTLDDPQEIRPEDEQAAIDLGGQKRYILYMKG